MYGWQPSFRWLQSGFKPDRVMPGPSADVRFGLEFKNADARRLVAGPGAEAWLQVFASIMGLRDQGETAWPAILFFQGGEGKDDLGISTLKRLEKAAGKELPGSGWIPRKTGLLRLWSHADERDFLCELAKVNSPEEMTLLMRHVGHVIHQQALSGGGVFFHAALAKKGPKAVLLAGPSGSGKSTCARRLSEPWVALCDDSALVVKDDGGVYWAHPFPTWSDLQSGACEKRWEVQSAVPLGAIFFVHKAEQDKALLLGQSRVLLLLFRMMQVLHRAISPYRDRQERTEIQRMFFDNASHLAMAVPGFSLGVSRTGRFWENVEKVINF
jgi:SynChlorMet cassette protein ScmC